jgi:ATPase subunit of ABC transporter with duplicated ATPase domains
MVNTILTAIGLALQANAAVMKGVAGAKDRRLRGEMAANNQEQNAQLENQRTQFQQNAAAAQAKQDWRQRFVQNQQNQQNAGRMKIADALRGWGADAGTASGGDVNFSSQPQDMSQGFAGGENKGI